MRRKTKQLVTKACDSLVLGVEVFNRPSDRGRVEGVLLFLDHAFEMLLKAVAFEKTGSIHNPREKQNYNFEKCVRICQSQLNVIDNDEALVLNNLNGFRDAAAHDIVEISEGLLYGHAQSAVQIFAALMKKCFARDLSRQLPRRVLPLSTSIPTDISTVVAEDLTSAAALLGGTHRREDEVEARLRPYRIMELNIRGTQGVTQDPPSIVRMVKHIKKGDWKTTLPMVAGLVQSSPSGIPLSLHLTKHDGFPVRVDPNATTTIAFRYVKPEDKYPYLTGELASKLGISSNRTVGFVRLFQMKGNDEYHTSIKASKTGYVQRYSEKAKRILETAIAQKGIVWLWDQVKAKKQLKPQDFDVPGVTTSSNNGNGVKAQVERA